MHNFENDDLPDFVALAKMTEQIVYAVLNKMCRYNSPYRSNLRRDIYLIVKDLKWTVSDDVDDLTKLVLADPRITALTDTYPVGPAPVKKPPIAVPKTPQVKLQPKETSQTTKPTSAVSAKKTALDAQPKEDDGDQVKEYKAVDDNVLSAEILQLIKRDRWMDYTTDQVADALSVAYRDASRIIRKLPEDTGVVKLSKLVNGRSTAVFQYVPERSIYRHPGHRSKLDIMCKFIGELLRHRSDLCQKEIIEKARFLLGGADEHLVRDALRMMVGVGLVIEEKGHRYRTHYRLNTDLDDSTKRKRKSALKSSPEFRKYYRRCG